MTRLLRVEAQRLAARRLVRLLLLLLFLALLGTAVVQGVKSNRDLAGARAEAERQASQFHLAPEEIQACEADARARGVPPEALSCRPTAAQFYGDPRLNYARNAPLYANAGVGLGLAFAGITAIGVIGAEWAAGTFAALLLWEPRRRRVLAAKLAASSLAGAVVTAASAAGFVGVAWVIAATRGSLSGRTGAATLEAVQNGGRGVLASVLLAVILGSLAVVVRSTAGALGIVAIYTIVVENVIRALRPHWTRWELGPNLIALITGRLDLEPLDGTGHSLGEELFRLSGGRAIVYLVTLAVLAAAAAAFLLQRRDVT